MKIRFRKYISHFYAQPLYYFRLERKVLVIILLFLEESSYLNKSTFFSLEREVFFLFLNKLFRYESLSKFCDFLEFFLIKSVKFEVFRQDDKISQYIMQ